MVDPLNIAQSLKEDRSKKNVILLVNKMARESFDFDAYLNVVEASEMPVKWYMTWVLSHYFEEYPSLKSNHQIQFWKFIETIDNPSMLRDCWRSLSFLNLDEEISGYVYDAALKIVPSQSYPIAVRAHAMTSAFHVAKDYPELCAELSLVLSELPIEDTAGILARAKNILAELKKYQKAQS